MCVSKSVYVLYCSTICDESEVGLFNILVDVSFYIHVVTRIRSTSKHKHGSGSIQRTDYITTGRIQFNVLTTLSLKCKCF